MVYCTLIFLCKVSHSHSRVQQIHSEFPIITTVWRSEKDSSLHNLGIVSGVTCLGVEMAIKTPACQDCMINNRDIISQSVTSTAARSSQNGLRRDQIAYGNDIIWQTDMKLGQKMIFLTYSALPSSFFRNRFMSLSSNIYNFRVYFWPPICNLIVLGVWFQ